MTGQTAGERDAQGHRAHDRGEAGSGHPGGSLSCADILRRCTSAECRSRLPSDPDWEARDRFILAKGHAAPALYAVLSPGGLLPREEL